MIQRSPNQTVPPFKNPKKISHPLACSPFGKFLLSNFQEPGILQAPPPFLSHSYPPFSLRPPVQPPLLPLPAAHPRCAASTRGLSCRPTKRNTGNNNRTRETPNTPMRPKSSSNPSEENKIISSTTPLGNLTKTVAKALTLTSPGSAVFAISPPPSSLPLPRFSLRPKLCCKVEAAGIDTGATDDLRRLLRLR